jgi:hypothetical protein
VRINPTVHERRRPILTIKLKNTTAPNAEPLATLHRDVTEA